MNHYNGENEEQENFLHLKIKNSCLPLYREAKYRFCTQEAFKIVRSTYKEKFGSETIPDEFLSIYHVSGAFGSNGSKEDKNFQNGCLCIFRSINYFRNDMEHGDENDVSKGDAMHYMYLSSFALNFLDRMETYSNNLHPFNQADYISKKQKDTINFNYSNNNGRYKIGEGVNGFTIDVSKSGDDSLHLYNDPCDIRGIGLLEGTNGDLKDIDRTNLKRVDMSSRSRTINTNNLGVLLNQNGVYAFLRLKRATRSPDFNAEIEYCIHVV